jgi:hypothetical protein
MHLILRLHLLNVPKGFSAIAHYLGLIVGPFYVIMLYFEECQWGPWLLAFGGVLAWNRAIWVYTTWWQVEVVFKRLMGVFTGSWCYFGSSTCHHVLNIIGVYWSPVISCPTQKRSWVLVIGRTDICFFVLDSYLSYFKCTNKLVEIAQLYAL